jgi:hypothetical protein
MWKSGVQHLSVRLVSRPKRSQLTTIEQTSRVPMPTCKYQILDGTEGAGADIRFAFVGQMVYHKWTCETSTTDTFCMTIYNCYVDDGKGDKVSPAHTLCSALVRPRFSPSLYR